MVRVKGRQGEQIWVKLPVGKTAQLDEARGRYFSRSRFVLLALDRAIREANSGTLTIEKEGSLDAQVSSKASNVLEDSSNISPNTLAVKESLAGVR